jgi:hypothetical protein
LNTGVVGGIISRVELHLPVDISFEDFFSRVCARMDLDPLTAELGYKFHTDRRRDAYHQLANEAQLRTAMTHGVGLMQRVRTRRVTLEIENLVCLLMYLCLFSMICILTLSQHPARQAASATRGRGTKRNVDEFESNPSLSTTLTFTSELRQLKAHLSCAKHPGKWCYVDPVKPGDHIHLDIFKLTLWAKKIVSS